MKPFTTHLVVDARGAEIDGGPVSREVGLAYGLEAVIEDLLAGEYREPIAIVEVDLAAGTARDVSARVANLLANAAIGTVGCTGARDAALLNFVDRNASKARGDLGPGWVHLATSSATGHCRFTRKVGVVDFLVEFSAVDGRWIIKMGREVLADLHFSEDEAMARVDAMAAVGRI